MNTLAKPITLTAFRWVPQSVRGLVRDLRVRWALEEAGLPYTVKFISATDKTGAEYRKWQPFGQVPAFAQGELELFESGAIVLHIAEQSEALMPKDPAARARVRAWLFAALDSVQIMVWPVAEIDLIHGDAEWAKSRRPHVEGQCKTRLAALAAALGDREYLEGGRFTAADLMMVMVLRMLRKGDLIAQYPTLMAYQERCEARPAFRKALDDQLADYVDEPIAA